MAQLIGKGYRTRPPNKARDAKSCEISSRLIISASCTSVDETRVEPNRSRAFH